MPTYNKLVRHRIPEVIERTGKSFNTTILSKEDYIKELKKKSYEVGWVKFILLKLSILKYL